MQGLRKFWEQEFGNLKTVHKIERNAADAFLKINA